MENGGPTTAQIIVIALFVAGPPIAFIILYAVDYFFLAKEGVYTKDDSPAGELAFMLLLPIVGIPFALLHRRRAVKGHYELGGKPLGGRYIFFNVAFGVVLGIWALLVLCSVCSWINLATGGAA